MNKKELKSIDVEITGTETVSFLKSTPPHQLGDAVNETTDDLEQIVPKKILMRVLGQEISFDATD